MLRKQTFDLINFTYYQIRGQRLRNVASSLENKLLELSFMARRRFFGTLRWMQIVYCSNYYCDMCSSNSHSVDKTLRQTSDENFLLETSALISLSVLMALLSTLSCFYLSLRICKGVEFTVRRLKTFLNCFNIMYVYPCVQWALCQSTAWDCSNFSCKRMWKRRRIQNWII